MNTYSSSALPRRSSGEIQRAVIHALVLRELRSRVGGRWLGLMWVVGEPLAHASIILLLLTYVRGLRLGGLDVPVFLVTGILPYFMFRNLALRVADAVAANRGLFGYRQVQPLDTMVARALVEIGLYSAVYGVMLTLLGWLDHPWLPYRPLECLAVLMLLAVLGFGLALIIAVASRRRPRVRAGIGLMFLPLYLASGAIVPLHGLSADVRSWLLLNPVLHLVDLSRAHFIEDYQRLPGVSVHYPAAWALVSLALGLALYTLERHRLRSDG